MNGIDELILKSIDEPTRSIIDNRILYKCGKVSFQEFCIYKYRSRDGVRQKSFQIHLPLKDLHISDLGYKLVE